MNNICMVVYTRTQRVFILEVNIFKCVLLLGQLEIKILHTLLYTFHYSANFSKMQNKMLYRPTFNKDKMKEN